MGIAYISPSGAGNGSGDSQANAVDWNSGSGLGTAETLAGASGTIYFLDGDYPFGGNETFTGANGLTYESLNLQKAVLGDSGSQRQLTFGGTAHEKTLKNFKFLNIYLDAQSFTANLTIQGCFFSRDTPNATNGLTIRATGGATGTAGVFLTLKNCIIKWDLTGSSDGSRLFQGPYFKLLGCSFDITGAGGISNTMNYNDGPPNEMKNNIWKCDTDTAMSSSNAFADNSTFSSFFQMGSTNDSGGTNNLYDTDPLFVDSANNDYRLRPSSPCINAGTSS